MADKSASFKVDGLKELVASLRRIDSEYPKHITQIHKRIAAPVAQRAKAIVTKLTGRLSSSIRPLSSQKAATVAAGYKRLPYAGVQHYGWPGHNIEPQYYLTRALEDERDETFKRYEDELVKFINGVWVH